MQHPNSFMTNEEFERHIESTTKDMSPDMAELLRRFKCLLNDTIYRTEASTRAEVYGKGSRK